MTKDELRDSILAREWFHTIDLGDGLVTPGNPPSEVLSRPGSIPDVAGRSVLDIGAWDGKYSFEAERAGAARVVALDEFIWKLDPAKLNAYYAECEQNGRLPDPVRVATGFLDAEWLPGKQGFEMAHEYLDSNVESVVDDFLTLDLDRLGRFDVVFYFGVLYHMLDPMGALRRVRDVTGELAVIETLAVDVEHHADSSLLEFYPGKERVGDHTNWFAPNETALHGMCLATGFSRVETKAKSLVVGEDPPGRRGRRRSAPPRPPVQGYRIVVHAYR